jgi:class 3 adenylate cyclase/pimeloyl-ACP methyl ester carboxylesterase
MEPETQYVRSTRDATIAYQVVGDGPIDLLNFQHFPFSPPLDHWWEEPLLAHAVRRLASFSRLILYDRRGLGLSDRVGVHSPEEDLDDALAVMDEVGSERAAVVGWTGGGMLAMLLAAAHPERVSHLVLYCSFASALGDEEYPLGLSPEAHAAEMEQLVARWGTWRSVEPFSPTVSGDDHLKRWWARMERSEMTPRDLRASMLVLRQLDVRPILPSISVPTLILHRESVPIPVENAAYLAERIPGAKVKVLPGNDMVAWLGDWDGLADEIEAFVAGDRRAARTDRVLAAVMFTDIVGSTRRAAEIGDHKWRHLLDEHDAITRHEVERHSGRVVEWTGDGALATFDGPARAIRCAQSIQERVRTIGLEVRAGVHIGEIEVREHDVGGIAVHIGARIAALAGPSEVLVSRTVKDLVVGSGLTFADRGTHPLKGVPDEWQLFAVEC